jgi:HD-like signal output (HDOD) protein
VAVFGDDAQRRQDRLRRRTTRLDKMFAFGPGTDTGFKPIYLRGEAEQRASTVLAANIKALPAIVIEAGKSAGPDAEGLETAIEADPQLASLVMSAGASSFLNRGGGSPKHLMALLQQVGPVAFRNITFAAAFYRILKEPLVWYGYGPGGLWRHTVAVAIAAWKLAEAIGFEIPVRDMLVFGSLFHDIGKPTIQGLMTPAAPPAFEGSGQGQLNVLETERRVVNMTHSELVPLILDIWGVEHSIFGVAEHHHAPQRAGAYAIQASIVQLADVIANADGVGLESEYPFANVPLDKAAAKMNISLGVCQNIRDQLGLLVAEISTDFESANGA